MSKCRPNLYIEAHVWDQFKKQVDNASKDVQAFMSRRIDPEQDTIEGIELKIRELEDKKAELEAESIALQMKKEEIEAESDTDG